MMELQSKTTEQLQEIYKAESVNGNHNLYEYEPCSEGHDAFHSSTANIRACFGGNRSGKTTVAVVDAILQATGGHWIWSKIRKPPLQIRLVSTDFLNGIKKVIVPTIFDWLPRKYFKDYRKDDQVILLKNGSFVELMSYDQEVAKFGGSSRDLTIFDEYPPKAIYSECQMRHIDCAGSTIMSMTPPVVGGEAGEEAWVFDEIYEMDGKNGIECFNFSMFDNPHNDPRIIEQITKSLDEVEYDIRVRGRFRSLSGRVFKDFGPRHIVPDFSIPEMERRTHKAWTRYCAFDPHPNKPFAGLYCAVDPNNFVWFYDEIYEPDLSIPELAQLILSREGKLPHPIKRLMDPSASVENKIFRQASIREQLMRCGVHTQEANNSFDSSYYAIKEALQFFKCSDGEDRPRIFFMQSLTNTIYQMSHYVWDRWAHNAANKSPKQKPKKKDDDLVDCLRYIMNANPTYVNFEKMKLRNKQLRQSRPYRTVQ